MGLSQEFRTAVAAVQTGIRVNTDEIPDALATISDVCEKNGWLLRVWDATKGLQSASPISFPTKAPPPGTPAGMAAVANKPPASQDIGSLDTVLIHVSEPGIKQGGDDSTPVVVVMKNFHLTFEKQRESMVAAVQHLIEHGKEHAKYLVGLMPTEAQLPPEVDPLFHIITHELPDAEELTEILEMTIGDIELKVDKKAVVAAALGLTRLQAEGVFAASLVTEGVIAAGTVWRFKADILNKEGLVKLDNSPVRFSDVGGLTGSKDFVLRVIEPDPLDAVEPDSKAKGVLLVGPPGTGKSLLAYCTGNEIKQPTILIDMGSLKDQYVGNSEKRTRKMFQIVRRMAPCVAVVDEVNMALGSGGGGEHSVDRNILGSFLTNLNDIKERVFWMFTANDVEGMHEAIFRAERIDAKIYVKLPGPEQRAVIWRLNIKKFFPAQIDGKDDPRHIPLDLDKLLATYKKVKPKDREAFAATVTAVLMTMAPGEREEALTTIGLVADEELKVIVSKLLIDDNDWTGAEIKSCCRLARRLKQSLPEAAKKIGHVCLGARGRKIIDRLNKWAVNEGALDSETGELFQLPINDVEAADGTEASPKPSFGKSRRRVRQS